MESTRVKKVAKNFLVGNLQSTGWLLLYGVLEVLLIFGLINVLLKFSTQFQIDFVQIFGWLTESDSMSNLEYSKTMMESCAKLTDTIVLPVLGVSSIAVIGILAIKCKKTKAKVIKKISGSDLAKYMFIGMSLNLIITVLINLIPEQFMETYNMSVSAATDGSLFLTVVVAGILAPIQEEILFRNLIYDGCKKVGIAYAVIASSLYFGVMHGNIIQGTYATVMGLVFVLIDIKKENLLPSICMHITINLSSVLIAHFVDVEMTGLIIGEIVIALIFLVTNRELMANTIKKIRNKEITKSSIEEV